MVLVAAAVAVALFGGAASAAPDLVVTNSDVSINVRSPTQGNMVTLEAQVRNTGDANASGFTLRFTLDASSTLANVAVSSLGAGAAVNVTASWAVGSTALGGHTLAAIADATGAVTENSEGNNQGQLAFEVNEPPTATATVNATTQDTYVMFSFDGSTSADTDGTIESYLWLFDDGSVATAATTTHQYADGSPTPGKLYTVTLLVTDDDGGTSTDQVSVRVVNRAPAASTGDVLGFTVTALVFDGSSSADIDGRIVNATWAFSDGVTLYGLTVLRSFGDDGSYSATLTVRDDDGATDSIGITIEITNQEPTAIISTSPVMPFQPNTSAFFNGANSFDVDGGITNYTWVFPGGVTVLGWNATYMFTQNGTYNVTLVLVDDDGALGELTIAALVGNDTIGTRVPTPPVGRIAPSATTVFTGVPVTLDASASTDDTGIISYLWDFADGIQGVGVVVVHSWPNDGNFIVMLNVTDTDGNSSFASVTIHVMDRPPKAAILASPTDAPTLTLVSFDASSSSDPDGTLLYYRWSFGDGSVLYGRNVQHTYARAGAYTVTLTVTDNDGVEGSDSAVITVTNRAPRAVAPANFSVPTFVERIFDASGSFDLDGLVQTYTWAFGDGTNATGRSVKHAFATIGVFAVTLTVRDDFGATGSTTMAVTVTNNAPSVSIAGPTAISTGDTAVFGGTAIDRDGTVSSWAWTFGDGGTATTPNSATHPYPNAGTYTVTLTATDNNLASATATFTITVHNRLPTARITQPGQNASFQSLAPVSFSASGSSDPETAAGALEFFWIFGDGGVASGLTVIHAFSTAGTFTVILTVSDGDGGAASATLPVVIQNQAPRAVPAADVATATTLTPVRFDAGGSSDPDGTVQSYLWDFGDGSTSSSKVAEHTYLTASPPGTPFTVRLSVFDNLGLGHSQTMEFVVSNRNPVGAIVNGEPLYATLTSFFKGTSSTDPDGIVVGYSWSFGDGSTAEGGEASHVFAAAGVYNVTLTVTDDRGGVTAVTKEVSVQAKPNYGTVGGGPVEPPRQPGFEAVGGLVALGLAGALAAASRRRRQA